MARAIHNQSPRRAQPFVAVNLAAIPDTLLVIGVRPACVRAIMAAHSPAWARSLWA